MTNSVDSDKILHYLAFHLGLQCLYIKNPFSGFPYTKGYAAACCTTYNMPLYAIYATSLHFQIEQQNLIK